jgi:ribosomal protein L34E
LLAKKRWLTKTGSGQTQENSTQKGWRRSTSAQTGNELNGVPAAWTNEIADFIKGELGAENAFSWSHSNAKPRSFDQDRLGTNIGGGSHKRNTTHCFAGAKQLVFDGIDSERLGGVANVSEAELAAKSVDCYTDHFYPVRFVF